MAPEEPFQSPKFKLQISKWKEQKRGFIAFFVIGFSFGFILNFEF
jgi:hypothetical protein